MRRLIKALVRLCGLRASELEDDTINTYGMPTVRIDAEHYVCSRFKEGAICFFHTSNGFCGDRPCVVSIQRHGLKEESLVTAQEFGEFLRDYYRDRKSQRLGQAFCNRFNVQDSQLFYEIMDIAAINRISGQHLED